MVRFCPKLEIINHFDDLIHQIDIDIEESIEKYGENQAIGKLECFQFLKRDFKDYHCKFKLDYFIRFKISSTFRFTSHEDKLNAWEHFDDQFSFRKSTKLVDYLNRIRNRTIEELRKVQIENVENSSNFDHLKVEITNETNIEELKSQMFSDKFHFQVKIQRPDDVLWIFNLFTFITDFYMSPSDINILQSLINQKGNITTIDSTSKIIFDEKMVLIGLLLKYLYNNILNQKFPNHVIRVSKKDLLNIKRMDFHYEISGINLTNSLIDLSKLEYLNIVNSNNRLEEIKIEGLSSLIDLKLKINSVENISLKSLNALRDLEFDCSSKTSSRQQNDLIASCKTIETFYFSNGSFRFRFKSSKSLYIRFDKNDEDLDFGFVYTFYEHIKKLTIWFGNNDTTEKLLSGHNFPRLKELDITFCYITRIDKKMFNGSFPMLETLYARYYENLEKIDYEVFLNMRYLKGIYLYYNYIMSLDKSRFSNLGKLMIMDRYRHKYVRIYECPLDC